MLKNKKKKKMEEKREENQLIYRLPDDIIFAILQKHLGPYPNAKDLIHLSIISKRFDSIILQHTTNVTLQIPNWKPIPSNHLFESYHTVLHNTKVKLIMIVIQAKFSPPIKFLAKFSSITSLRIHFQPSGDYSNMENNLIRWKSELVGTNLSKYIVILCANRFVCTEFGDESDEELDDEELEAELTEDVIDLKMHVAGFHIVDIKLRYALVHFIISGINDTVREIEITDENNYHDRIVMRREQIVGLRSLEYVDEISYTETARYKPRIQLPRFTSVMKEVSLVVIKSVDDNGDGEDDESIIRRAFEGQEEYLMDAAMKFLEDEQVGIE